MGYYDVGGGLQALDVMRGCMEPMEFEGFLRGNCVKYAVRLGRKGGREDAARDAEKLSSYAGMLAQWYREEEACSSTG